MFMLVWVAKFSKTEPQMNPRIAASGGNSTFKERSKGINWSVIEQSVEDIVSVLYWLF